MEKFAPIDEAPHFFVQRVVCFAKGLLFKLHSLS